MEYDILNKTKQIQSLKVCLKPGDVIPLHDHPSTQVFMYVLSGRLKVDFYRYVDKEAGTIELEESKEMVAGDSALITDADINLHHIEALEASAFLDVMTPGYLENESICPTWLRPVIESNQIKVCEVSQPEDIVEAKKRAVAAFERASKP